ncbi:MAG: EAL domain-containing protein (putative c-di-GMP-specific phosphodiesterase class I) [Granulosicoccus sp.]|jgi:EAL domain-containing protein (putative c-di-GMP-specific phosphodiesterase class I)
MSNGQIPPWIAKTNAIDIEPGSVLIEITEGVLLENDDNNIELLSSLNTRIPVFKANTTR